VPKKKMKKERRSQPCKPPLIDEQGPFDQIALFVSLVHVSVCASVGLNNLGMKNNKV